MSKRLETVFAGVTFKNPVALASGTCGFGKIGRASCRERV